MARSTPPASDPLADLRAPEPEVASLPNAEPPAPPQRAIAPEGFTPEAATSRIVQAYHDDTTAVGILHRGGTCGCHYLARMALRTSVEETPTPEAAQSA